MAVCHDRLGASALARYADRHYVASVIHASKSRECVYRTSHEPKAGSERQGTYGNSTAI